MGHFSGTREDQTMMFRCGGPTGSGCGKVLTEAQVEKFTGCPRCGSQRVAPFYPKTKFGRFMCYLRLIIRGEAWVRSQARQND